MYKQERKGGEEGRTMQGEKGGVYTECTSRKDERLPLWWISASSPWSPGWCGIWKKDSKPLLLDAFQLGTLWDSIWSADRIMDERAPGVQDPGPPSLPPSGLVSSPSPTSSTSTLPSGLSAGPPHPPEGAASVQVPLASTGQTPYLPCCLFLALSMPGLAPKAD